MNKRKIEGLLLGMSFLFLFTGCSDNLGTGMVDTISIEGTQTEATLTALEEQILELEERYRGGEFTAQDYLEVSKLYQEQGWIRAQRDMLEEGWRLYGEEEIFLKLQDITVNVEEEEEDIRSQAALLQQNLALEEYRNEAVNLLSSAEWFSKMMPKVYEGKRSYYLQDKASKSALQIEVGYEESGLSYTEAWYTDSLGQIIQLRVSASEIRMLRTGVAEGKYEGDFESWLVVPSTGDVFFEQGNFQQAVLVGDYTSKVHLGEAEVDAYSLWFNREGMEFIIYYGNFDQDGRTVLKQPSAEEVKLLQGSKEDVDYVAYAYDDKEENFLFVRVPKETGAQNLVFQGATFGIHDIPDYLSYEVQPRPPIEEHLNVEVRVFDGKIQFFDGESWTDLGAVETYLKQDPFLQYETERGASAQVGQTSEEEDEIPAGDSPLGVIDRRLGAGIIEKPETTKPSQSGGTSKPAQKPTTTPKPTTPSTPVAPSEPAPSEPAPSEPAPSAPAPSTPAPTTPESTPPVETTPPSTEPEKGDVDVEWSPSLL